MLDDEYLDTAVEVMRARDIEFAPGLTEHEIAKAEAALDFRFPPDLKRFLMHAFPVGERFPDWRDPRSDDIAGRLDWPAHGICFDVEKADFWLPEWGRRPDALEDAFARARRAVRDAPFLIPVFGHRYIPDRPAQAGNPVFSVHQTDIIIYGTDLPAYFEREFDVPNPYPVPAGLGREIELWTELVRVN